MKGFIEVNVYEYDDGRDLYNKNTYKIMFPIERIAISQRYILFEGIKYRYYQSYEEIKQLIKNAQ